MGKALTISAIVHTRNSAPTLARALESLSFVGEVIVVDMQSSDETRLIAQKYGAQVVSVENADFVEPARQFGIDQANHEWILILDADEEVPVNLQTKLTELAETKNEINGYYLPRLNHIFGTWLKHTGWWPDYQLRFFRKGTVTWPATLHAVPHITGKTEKLAADEKLALKHYNYATVEQFIERLNRYTSLEITHSSHEMASHEFTQASFFRTFSQQFLSRYFRDEGFKDGGYGMSLALLQAMYEVTVNLKKWQAQNFVTKEGDKAVTVRELREFQSELNYWLADSQISSSSGLTRIWWQCRRKLRI